MPSRFSVYASVALVFFLALPSGALAQAQLRALFESPAEGKSDKKPADPTPEEQLVWVETQIDSATADVQNFESEAFQHRLSAAAPISLTDDDFLSPARSVVRNYSSARDILQNVIRAENALNSSDPVPATRLPTTAQEAFALRQLIAELNAKIQAKSASSRLGESLLNKADGQRESALQHLRRIEKEPAAPDQPDQAALRLQLSQLELQAAESAVFFGRWRIYQESLDLRLLTRERDEKSAALKKSGMSDFLQPSQIEERLGLIESVRNDLQDRLQNAQKASAAQMTELEQARQIYQQAMTESGASPSSAEARKLEAIKGRLALARQVAASSERLVYSIQSRLILLDEESKSWLNARRVTVSQEVGTLQEIRTEVEGTSKLLIQIRDEIDRSFAEASEMLTDLRGLDPASPQLQALLQTGITNAESRLQTIREFREQVVLMNDLLQAIDRKATEYILEKSWQEKTSQQFAEMKEMLGNLWDYQLTGSDASPFTVGKLVLVVFGLIAAFLLAGAISRRAARTLRRRKGASEGQVVFVERWIFYILLVIFFFTTLNWLQIPLTVFAFLGGALAIGLGFGGQNLMNNFISGLILMVERKIRVGDLVETDGFVGRVLDLGTRCSRIRKFDGVEVLVPNSHLLEKNVINWTLSDPQHRYNFTVGVAYGSDTAVVLKILQQCLNDQPELLKEPGPLVFFEAFGDSTLDFGLYYWVEIGTCDARQVGSEIRLRIDQACRKEGIEIAFPQRDIHLHAASPIPVSIAGK